MSKLKAQVTKDIEALSASLYSAYMEGLLKDSNFSAGQCKRQTAYQRILKNMGAIIADYGALVD